MFVSGVNELSGLWRSDARSDKPVPLHPGELEHKIRGGVPRFGVGPIYAPQTTGTWRKKTSVQCAHAWGAAARIASGCSPGRWPRITIVMPTMRASICSAPRKFGYSAEISPPNISQYQFAGARGSRLIRISSRINRCAHRSPPRPRPTHAYRLRTLPEMPPASCARGRLRSPRTPPSPSCHRARG